VVGGMIEELFIGGSRQHGLEARVTRAAWAGGLCHGAGSLA